jgi:hypothetical protein
MTSFGSFTFLPSTDTRLYVWAHAECLVSLFCFEFTFVLRLAKGVALSFDLILTCSCLTLFFSLLMNG